MLEGQIIGDGGVFGFLDCVNEKVIIDNGFDIESNRGESTCSRIKLGLGEIRVED